MTEATIRDSAGMSTLYINIQCYGKLMQHSQLYVIDESLGPVNRLLTEFFLKDETNCILDDVFPTCNFCGGTPQFYVFKRIIIFS